MISFFVSADLSFTPFSDGVVQFIEQETEKLQKERGYNVGVTMTRNFVMQ